jgi:riboflavin kinase/FMN adenylyltransferase
VETGDNLIPGMAYIGGRLTFDDEAMSVEVNLFDFNGDLSGKKIKMILEEYTRAPQKFDSVDELKEALANDKKQVTKILNI